MSALSDALNEANRENWSAAEIARRSGDLIHRATAANVMRGKHAANPSDEVLQAFAVVFPTLTLKRLRRLAGQPAGEQERYVPPPEADRLNARQRKALDELIRSMAAEDATARRALELVDRSDPDSVAAFLDLDPGEFIVWTTSRLRSVNDPDAPQPGAEPDVAKVLAARRKTNTQEAEDRPAAARRGTPRLRSVKKQQDDAGEAPDPEGPEGGS